MQTILFLIFAFGALSTGIVMVLQPNPVRSALFLVLNLFCVAVLYLLLNAWFLAAVQVLVYAGAIMVLFLFVIMFLGVDRREALMETIRGQRGLAIGLGALLVGVMVVSIRLGVGLTGAPGPAAEGDNVEAVGRTLFTKFVFPFEVTSILLIVAAIAAMVLARRRGRGMPEPEEEEAIP